MRGITENEILCDGRADWLSKRRSSLGASDSAAILGHGYAEQNAATVWHSKIGPVPNDTSAMGKRLRYGLLMEPAIRAIFAEETGLECLAPDHYLINQHPDHNFITTTLDGFCLRDGTVEPVELKNVDTFQAAEWRDGGTPLKFAIQLQHQIAVTGAERGHLFALVGGNEGIHRVMERNDTFIATLIDRLTEFWGLVASRTMPPIDDSKATANVIKALHPLDNGTAVLFTDDMEQWIDQLASAKDEKTSAEQREREAKNHLMDAIGPATYGQTPDGRVMSWKHQTRAEYVAESSTFRVLRCAKGLPRGVIAEQRDEN